MQLIYSYSLCLLFSILANLPKEKKQIKILVYKIKRKLLFCGSNYITVKMFSHVIYGVIMYNVMMYNVITNKLPLIYPKK